MNKKELKKWVSKVGAKDKDGVIVLNLSERTRKVLATLTPREEKIIRTRFGIK